MTLSELMYLDKNVYCVRNVVRTITLGPPTARVLASQAEAIVRTRKTWPQATKRRTRD